MRIFIVKGKKKERKRKRRRKRGKKGGRKRRIRKGSKQAFIMGKEFWRGFAEEIEEVSLG